jgi:hypothetical protein
MTIGSAAWLAKVAIPKTRADNSAATLMNSPHGNSGNKIMLGPRISKDKLAQMLNFLIDAGRLQGISGTLDARSEQIEQSKTRAPGPRAGVESVAA